MTIQDKLKSLIDSQFKNLGTGIILLILSTIISIIFLSEREPNFLTYNNSEQGININYPETWTQQKETDFLCTGVIFNSPYEKESDSFRERVKICVEDLTNSLTLQEYSNQSVREITENNIIIEQPKSITVGNKEGIKVVYKDNDKQQKMEVWTIKNNKAYVLTYTAEIKWSFFCCFFRNSVS